METLPGNIEFELRQMGVIPIPATKSEQPVVPRTFEFRKPVFDEHGQPDF
jgi:hypothetical protein